MDFNEKGKYSPPEFIWNVTVAPTALKFFNSDKLGKEYENDMFVGDFKNGNLYHFDLTRDRTELELKGSLHDKLANSMEELNELVFAYGFRSIADLEVGPDGYLYILSISDGTIYRILSKSSN